MQMTLGTALALLFLRKKNIIVIDSQLIIQKLNSSKLILFLIGGSSCHPIEFSCCLLVPKSL